ncbi:unnamed protein product [Rhizoctonia solani]|uniref:Uncharacterized protein n=1 Tax=Rhizoctonia solani TaxID=456999 RepID=A0A8H3E8E4_9AGAM|nr:unnamed protein product [Rhizoctonia solani]
MSLSSPNSEAANRLEHQPALITMDTQHTEENNNALEPPGVSLQARGERPVHARSRSFRAVIFMLMGYGISVVLYHTISKSFPEVVCQLPVVSSYSPICVRELDHPRTPVINPDFITLSRLQSRLGDVLEDSASSPMAADCIKGSARDLRDLVGRVKRSSLVSKDILGKELEHFVEDAKEASKSLRELGSRVWGVTDQIISFNDRILIVLDNPGRPFSSVVNFLIPLGRETADIHRRRMEGIWFEAIKLLKGNIGSLIHQTEYNVDLLQRLEKRLDIVQGMTDEEEENTRNEEREVSNVS